MSHGYVPVQWNARKRTYDIALWVGIALYIAGFMVITSSLHSGDKALSGMIVMMRAFASLAFILLTLILSVGPLARLDKRFLPLLYNRRHMGVSMFIIALAHAILALLFYHSFGVINPIASLFSSPGSYTSFADAPFQTFGFFALLILFFMAATSHDYWNKNLGAPFWKALHMCVYLAYALIVIHIALGALQQDEVGVTPLMVASSLVLVSGLHIAAALKSLHVDRRVKASEWIDIGSWRDIPNNSGISVSIDGGERVAVFRYQSNKLAAVSNACEHQNGPLCEGRVIDGLITCPWHGFQYRPEDGQSPPPFTEKIATYELRLDGDVVLLKPTALPAGTARPVLEISELIAANDGGSSNV